MMSKHVLVETNWIVDVVAPSLSRNRDAVALCESARRGEVILHVPAICFVEARKVIRERRPRADLEAIRSFIRDRRDSDELDGPIADAGFDVLSRFTST
jgi:predicted nucleic acid-binding protein